jgi:hypothetical protein
VGDAAVVIATPGLNGGTTVGIARSDEVMHVVSDSLVVVAEVPA